ncbi:uncharacterized protein FTOL_01195 [Fusarium torulosum]|uniref:Uncharacterized protein n=1 Tax=Fusarium torulosum TaxID=33205 RepID=A0AAE8LZM7_9HYPO|nr:uncharacterized protein FTOL_01195 [Fusarium torulosum]
MVFSRTERSHGKMSWLLARFVGLLMVFMLLNQLWSPITPLLCRIPHGNWFAILCKPDVRWNGLNSIAEYLPLPPPLKPKLHPKSIKDIDSMMEKYIQPLQGKPVEILLIGLGCNVDKELGASYYTWRTLLPGVELDVIEVDSECVERFERQDPTAQIYVDKLEAQFIGFHPKRRRLQYDIVIDRGLFSMHKRVTGLSRYWDSVSPGGLYILENLSEIALIAADEDSCDLVKVDPRLPYNIISGYSPREYVYAMLDDMVRGYTELHINDETVECLDDICVMKK